MRLTEFMQKIVKDFLIIFAAIIIILTFLRQLYLPGSAFDLESIYIIMAFSLLSALLGFILYTPNDINEKEMRLRIVIHFLTLEILLISLASIFSLVNSAPEAVILAVQIAVIYILVRLLSWQKDKKDAMQINEKLQALKKDS